MKMRKIFATLMMAVATTAVLSSCSNDDEEYKTVDASVVVGAYVGDINVQVNETALPAYENVGWSIAKTTADTITITTDALTVGNPMYQPGSPMPATVPLVISLKACNVMQKGDNVTFSIPAQSVTTIMGTLEVKTTGNGEYNTSSNEMGIAVIGGLMHVSQQVALPFDVELQGVKSTVN